MKKTFFKVNLNNCLKIGSHFMLIVTILQSFIILGYEVDDIINENKNWHCDILPRELPCLSRQGYALAIKRLILTPPVVVLLVVGMITRKYLLLVPWMIFRFFCIMVSSSLVPKFSEWLSWFGQNNLLIECLLVKKNALWAIYVFILE